MTVPEHTWRRLLLRWNQRVNLDGPLLLLMLKTLKLLANLSHEFKV